MAQDAAANGACGQLAERDALVLEGFVLIAACAASSRTVVEVTTFLGRYGLCSGAFMYYLGGIRGAWPAMMIVSRATCPSRRASTRRTRHVPMVVGLSTE